MTAVRVPHFRAPFAVIGGRVAAVEQNDPEEITQCVVAALRTRLGTLLDFPDFGVPHDVFRQQEARPTADAYLTAVERSEPRASVVGSVEFEDLIKHVRIEVAREND